MSWNDLTDIIKKVYDIIDELKALDAEEKTVREEVLEAFDDAIKAVKEKKE